MQRPKEILIPQLKENNRLVKVVRKASFYNKELIFTEYYNSYEVTELIEYLLPFYSSVDSDLIINKQIKPLGQFDTLFDEITSITLVNEKDLSFIMKLEGQIMHLLCIEVDDYDKVGFNSYNFDMNNIQVLIDKNRYILYRESPFPYIYDTKEDSNPNINWFRETSKDVLISCNSTMQIRLSIALIQWRVLETYKLTQLALDSLKLNLEKVRLSTGFTTKLQEQLHQIAGGHYTEQEADVFSGRGNPLELIGAI